MNPSQLCSADTVLTPSLRKRPISLQGSITFHIILTLTTSNAAAAPCGNPEPGLDLPINEPAAIFESHYQGVAL